VVNKLNFEIFYLIIIDYRSKIKKNYESKCQTLTTLCSNNPTQKTFKNTCKYGILIYFTIIVPNIRQVLNEHRYNCETEGKYVEAEMAQKRLEELKQQYYEQKL